ncbi:MAG: RNA polymerase factor sigma-32 [Polyangiaceae bacterium]|nr:RNA polymerase factor sigma-32 [Polyangiaceae bacterium]NUQ74277.1 RNA polymerase factor sigma-32 [Polyangiaceae bacterium]
MATKKSEPRQKRTPGKAEARSKTRTGAVEPGNAGEGTHDAKGPEGGTSKRTAARKTAPQRKKKVEGGGQAMEPKARAGSEDDFEHEGEDAGEREDRESSPPGEGDVIEVAGELVDGEPLEGDVEVNFDTGPAGPPISGVGSQAALSRTDPLQAYLREVQRHPLLTPEEEKTLTVHYTKTGDVATAARLVTANLRLVVKLAYEYRRAYKNIMDLIQEGNIGLMQAVKRYDPYRGVKLSSYAAWWIRAYILRFILNNWRLVKLGTTQAQRKLFFNLNKEKSKLSALGIEPTAAEIASRLNVDEKEVIDMDRRLSSSEASLDAPVGDVEGRSIARVELMPSSTNDVETIFEAAEVGELVHNRLQRFRETLKGKDIVIFDKRMAAEDPLTLQELGDEFGISRERVRQLEARLTTKLRQYLKEELGDAVGVS